jgi:hypothetical protein
MMGKRINGKGFHSTEIMWDTSSSSSATSVIRERRLRFIFLCCKLLLLLHCYASLFHHYYLTFSLLPLLKALSWDTMLRNFLPLF